MIDPTFPFHPVPCDIFPKADPSMLVPQNIFFFSDFGSDLREKRAFSRKVCSLEVVLKLKVLQFTFSDLVGLSGPPRDTGQ